MLTEWCRWQTIGSVLMVMVMGVLLIPDAEPDERCWWRNQMSYNHYSGNADNFAETVMMAMMKMAGMINMIWRKCSIDTDTRLMMIIDDDWCSMMTWLETLLCCVYRWWKRWCFQAAYWWRGMLMTWYAERWNRKSIGIRYWPLNRGR